MKNKQLKMVFFLMALSFPLVFISCKQDEPACIDCDPDIEYISGNNKQLNPINDVTAVRKEEITELDFNKDGISDVKFIFFSDIQDLGENLEYHISYVSVEGLNDSRIGLTAGVLKKEDGTNGSEAIPLGRVEGQGIDGSFSYDGIIVDAGLRTHGVLNYYKSNYNTNTGVTSNKAFLIDTWEMITFNLGNVKRFIPVKLKFPGETDYHYGWIEVNHTNNGNGVIRYYLVGYAYKLTPNEAIIAGRY
ncbi:MAG: hypothetical protein K1X55_14725 [Chitinophagales bacterium]|nr:hypothetical protein [Chitinophagales bacterium]